MLRCAMLHRVLGLSAAVLVVCLASACDSDDSGGAPAGAGQRSPACLAFQDAYCDLAADKCGQIARAACDDTFQSFFCKSDAAATACTNAVNTASCSGGTPDACKGLADTDAARNACNSLFGVICREINKCSGEDVSTCQAQLDTQVCSLAVGVSPSQTECASVASSGCANGKYALPAPCKGVVKTNSGTASLPWNELDLRPIASLRPIVADASVVARAADGSRLVDVGAAQRGATSE